MHPLLPFLICHTDDKELLQDSEFIVNNEYDHIPYCNL